MKLFGELMERRTHEDDEKIKALIKGSGRGEEILAAMGQGSWWRFRDREEIRPDGKGLK